MKKILLAVIWGTLGILLCAGCATTSHTKITSSPSPVKTPTEQSLIRETLDTWKRAIIAKDIDKVMTTYSENYQNNQGEGKQKIKEFLIKFREKGDLEGIRVEFSQMKIVMNGSTATASPIEISSDRGGMELSVTLGKETDKWLIVGSKRD